MTISKKMLIAGLFAVSTQFGVFAYGNTDNLKIMVNFAQDLRKTNTLEDKKVAKWLESVVMPGGDYYSPGEIAVIISIIESNVSKDAKMMRLLEIILKKNEANNKWLDEENKRLNEHAGNNSKYWQDRIKGLKIEAFAVGFVAAVYTGILGKLLYDKVIYAIDCHDRNLTASIIAQMAQRCLENPSKKTWW